MQNDTNIPTHIGYTSAVVNAVDIKEKRTKNPSIWMFYIFLVFYTYPAINEGKKTQKKNK